MSDIGVEHRNFLDGLSKLLLNDRDDIMKYFELESEVAHEMLRIRNGAGCLFDEYSSKGMVYERASSFDENEARFVNIWEGIIQINNQYVTQNERNKYDDTIKTIVEQDDKDPMWYELKSLLKDKHPDTVEEIRTQVLPKFRLNSHAFYEKRFFNARMVGISKRDNVNGKDKKDKDRNKEKKMTEFERSDSLDFDLRLPHDLVSKGYKLHRASQYLKTRIQHELDPYYTAHPLMMLYLTIAFTKARKPTYFSYGIRYLEIYMEKYAIKGIKYHYPFEFRSDGGFVSVQYHSHAVFRFKYVLNSLGNLLMNEVTHGYEPEYMDVANQALLTILSDVNTKGREMKSAFNMFNLYYGMSCKKPSRSDEFGLLRSECDLKEEDILYEDEHMHPRYPTFSLLNGYELSDVAYLAKLDCECCDITKADRGTFTIEVRNALKESIKMLRER